MPVQKAVSPMFKKYGAKLDGAVKNHAADPIEWGNVRIPPGITKGIAKLVTCKFDQVAAGKQNAGEYFFRAAGVVVEPKSVNYKGQEIEVVGMQTSIIEMVCDTRTSAGKVTTVDEHVASILNEMKKLGGAAFVEGAGGADLENLAAALQEAGPYFYFSTSESPAQLNPDGSEKYAARTWENWYGSRGLENYTPSEEGDDDQSGGGATGATSGLGNPDEFDETQGDAPELTPAELAEAADGDGTEAEEARDKLSEKAKELGWTDEQIEGVESWAVLATAVEAGEGPPEDGAGESDTASEAEWEPVVGDVYRYQPLDPKTKKPAINPKTKKALMIECEVKAVDKKAKTVDLLNIDDKKTKYAKVKWDALQGD